MEKNIVKYLLSYSDLAKKKQFGGDRKCYEFKDRLKTFMKDITEEKLLNNLEEFNECIGTEDIEDIMTNYKEEFDMIKKFVLEHGEQGGEQRGGAGLLGVAKAGVILYILWYIWKNETQLRRPFPQIPR